ncbi:MAG: molybdate ABC transporter permease subunit [Flavobacteriia bacterium]|nr:molybdate ABC transporter permease subunit [Flavobacteriia bacterium]
MDFQVIILTLKLALLTTFILLLIGIPVAYWLVYSKYKWKVIIESIVSLPIVLPPTVIGFYLLIFLSPENAFGKFLESYFNLKLVFTFEGLVIGSIIYSFPFMIQALKDGFALIPITYIHEAKVLGKSKRTILWKVLIPMIKRSIVTGCILTFTHTVGEFGVILMIGGNIPNETKVISIALFDEVEQMNYGVAHKYSLMLLIVSFLFLLFIYWKRNRKMVG